MSTLSEKEKMLAGELFSSADPELAADRLRARQQQRRYNTSADDDFPARLALLRELFAAVGDDRAYIEPPFFCDYGYNIRIGKRFYANYNCVFLDVGRIDIGDDCLIGPGAHIYTVNHPLKAARRAEGVEYARPVRLGHTVWSGGGAIVLPGVSIGDGAVIAAGAVVTRDVPANTLVAGNPARIVRELD